MRLGVFVVWVFTFLQLMGCDDDVSTARSSGDAGGGADTTSATSGGRIGGAGADGTSGVGAGGGTPIDPCSGFAVSVESVVYGEGAGFGQALMPGIVFGPPEGAGELSGSLHVVSLGNGGAITLGFGDQAIIDGDGPDFIVFENAFYAGGNPEAPFAELATVEVSRDGASWTAYPCNAEVSPYGTCAGWNPVFSNPADPSIEPNDPNAAGGDAFDLADIAMDDVRFIRITDRADLTGLNGAFDLDAIALIHATCE